LKDWVWSLVGAGLEECEEGGWGRRKGREKTKNKAVEFNQEKKREDGEVAVILGFQLALWLSSSPSVQRTIQKLKMNIAIETGVPRKAEAESLPLPMNNVFRKVRFWNSCKVPDMSADSWGREDCKADPIKQIFTCGVERYGWKSDEHRRTSLS
jgi:hypothetical protein